MNPGVREIPVPAQDAISSQEQARLDELTEDLNLSAPELRDERMTVRLYAQLRERRPVQRLVPNAYYSGRPGNTRWFVSRYRDVVEVFQDDERFSSHRNVGGGVPGPVPTEGPMTFADVDPLQIAIHSQKLPMSLDPPEFSTYRSLLNPLFSPREVRRKAAVTQGVADDLVTALEGLSEADLFSGLAKPLPAIVTCHLLGLDPEQWERFAIEIPEPSDGSGPRAQAGDDPDEQVKARVSPSLDAQLTMVELAEQRRREPKDDIITSVAHLTADGGRLLNLYEVGAILSILLSGGVHTTTLAIEAALLRIGRDPGLRARLTDDPELIRPFGEEVLRMWPPLPVFPRTVMRSTTLGGQALEPGDSLTLGIGAANRDPAEFPDPDTFDLLRKPNRHLTFAVGIHRCLGSTLARQEFSVAITELLTRLPAYEIDEERLRVPVVLDALPDSDRELGVRFLRG